MLTWINAGRDVGLGLPKCQAMHPMSVLGQNRKSSMRAYVFRCSPNNGHRLDTIAMSVTCQQPTSFDQFSCLYEERVRYRDAKGFCGLEIDHQIELGRLQDRQVGGLGTF